MSKIFNGHFPAVDGNTWENLVRNRLSVDVSLDEFDWLPDGDLKIQPFKMLPDIEREDVLRDPLPRLNPGYRGWHQARWRCLFVAASRTFSGRYCRVAFPPDSDLA